MDKLLAAARQLTVQGDTAKQDGRLKEAKNLYKQALDKYTGTMEAYQDSPDMISTEEMELLDHGMWQCGVGLGDLCCEEKDLKTATFWYSFSRQVAANAVNAIPSDQLYDDFEMSMLHLTYIDCHIEEIYPDGVMTPMEAMKNEMTQQKLEAQQEAERKRQEEEKAEKERVAGVRRGLLGSVLGLVVLVAVTPLIPYTMNQISVRMITSMSDSTIPARILWLAVYALGMGILFVLGHILINPKDEAAWGGFSSAAVGIFTALGVRNLAIAFCPQQLNQLTLTACRWIYGADMENVTLVHVVSEDGVGTFHWILTVIFFVIVLFALRPEFKKYRLGQALANSFRLLAAGLPYAVVMYMVLDLLMHNMFLGFIGMCICAFIMGVPEAIDSAKAGL